MKGPKKKKSDDEYDDDDWMSEFIGTTQDVDMDSITNTTQACCSRGIQRGSRDRGGRRRRPVLG